jgi:hypothetical protein
MFQIIALIIFVVSVGGFLFMLYKKIPLLVALPQNGHHGIKKPELVAKIEKKLKDKHFHFITKGILLQTILSKVRVIILKTERQIDTLLSGIRQKAQELDKQGRKKK